MSNSKKVHDSTIILACQNSKSMRQAAILCDMHFNTFKRRALLLGCYDINQSGKGTKKSRQPLIPLDEILEGLHPTYQTGKLKNRLIAANILPNRCMECNSPPIWNGKPLVFELEHINGISYDHRLENLKLLCPNCHSQTEFFRGRNKRTHSTCYKDKPHET